MKHFRVLACLVSLVFLLPSVLLNAQTLPKSPISGGVLAARAYRAGLLHPQAANGLLPGGQILTCSPTPCALPNVQASGGPQPVNEDPIATNLKNPKQLLTGGNDYNCSNIQGFYSSSRRRFDLDAQLFPREAVGEGDPIVGYDLRNVCLCRRHPKLQRGALVFYQ